MNPIEVSLKIKRLEENITEDNFRLLSIGKLLVLIAKLMFRHTSFNTYELSKMPIELRDYMDKV